MESANVDVTYIQRMALRETEAFSQFYDRYSSLVLGFLMKMFGNKVEAEDVLQETFWQVWRKAASYDPSRGSPGAWLIQMARSRGIDRLRQRKKLNERETEAIDNHLSIADHAPSGSQNVETQQEKILVRVALEELPSDQRQAIHLAFYEGLTHDEVSKKLNLPLGTIKTRIRLGMKKMQEALKLNLSPTGGVA